MIPRSGRSEGSGCRKRFVMEVLWIAIVAVVLFVLFRMYRGRAAH
jgi:hypothetical protein